MKGLFNFLKKKSAGESREHYSQDISSPESIDALIQQLSDASADCALLLGREVFRSSFAGTGDDYFFTDLVVPLAGNNLLSSGQGLRINFIYRDSPYQFYCTFSERRRIDGHDTLVFNKPSRIIYSDRREQARVQPADQQAVKVLFDLGSGMAPDVTIENISATGLAIRSPLTERMKTGAEVDRIELVLPGNEWISCRGVVRRVRGDLLGLELKGLSAHQRELLQAYVKERRHTTNGGATSE